MIIEVTGTLVIQPETREWCKLPYTGHPKGCPNYGISKECPPKIEKVNKIFNLSKKHWFAIEEFTNTCKKMLLLHKNWSQKQTKCCLYWQNSVRKKLKEQCLEFIYSHPNCIYTLIPEAMGINVFRTAYKHGIKINRNAYPIVYKIALIGEPFTV